MEREVYKTWPQAIAFGLLLLGAGPLYTWYGIVALLWAVPFLASGYIEGWLLNDHYARMSGQRR